MRGALLTERKQPEEKYRTQSFAKDAYRPNASTFTRRNSKVFHQPNAANQGKNVPERAPGFPPPTAPITS
jgi:hypothetical protein